MVSDGSTTIARAELVLPASTSIITESLMQCLHLLHQHRPMQTSDIGSIATRSALCTAVHSDMLPTTRHGKVMAVEALVLLKSNNWCNIDHCALQQLMKTPFITSTCLSWFQYSQKFQLDPGCWCVLPCNMSQPAFQATRFTGNVNHLENEWVLS